MALDSQDSDSGMDSDAGSEDMAVDAGEKAVAASDADLVEDLAGMDSADMGLADSGCLAV